VNSSSIGPVEIVAVGIPKYLEEGKASSAELNVGPDGVGAVSDETKGRRLDLTWKVLIAGERIPPRIEEMDKRDISLITMSAVAQLSEAAGATISAKDILLRPALPVKTTHTITKTSQAMFSKPCTSCGKQLTGQYAYCPWCGAKLGWDK